MRLCSSLTERSVVLCSSSISASCLIKRALSPGRITFRIAPVSGPGFSSEIPSSNSATRLICGKVLSSTIISRNPDCFSGCCKGSSSSVLSFSDISFIPSATTFCRLIVLYWLISFSCTIAGAGLLTGLFVYVLS